MSKVTYNEQTIFEIDLNKKINEGNIIIYPTDTVYGLGASIHNEKALKKIYMAKERDFNSPLIALISDYSYVFKIAKLNPLNKVIFEKLTQKFWPGALTIILDKKDIIPKCMVSNTESVGVRMPNLKLSLDIIEACGGVLATTSANISGQTTPLAYDELSNKIKNRVDIVVDGGKSPLGIESTIIDLRNKPKILRMGGISKVEIEEIIGKL